MCVNHSYTHFFSIRDRTSNQIFIMWEYLSFAASQCDTESETSSTEVVEDSDDADVDDAVATTTTVVNSVTSETENDDNETTEPVSILDTTAAAYDDDDDTTTVNTANKDDESDSSIIGYLALCVSFVSIIVSCLTVAIVRSQRSIDPLRRRGGGSASVSARKV